MHRKVIPLNVEDCSWLTSYKIFPDQNYRIDNELCLTIKFFIRKDLVRCQPRTIVNIQWNYLPVHGHEEDEYGMEENLKLEIWIQAH
jgi:hypothetical protein